MELSFWEAIFVLTLIFIAPLTVFVVWAVKSAAVYLIGWGRP